MTKQEELDRSLASIDSAFEKGAALTKPASRGGGGGRLNRTETVTVRLDPELNYLCELASRAQRRTKSSFIEWAVQAALREVEVPGTGGELGPHSVARLGPDLWDVDEPDRLVALAFNAPSLLTHEEQILWKLIRENGGMWLGGFAAWKDETWTWVVKPENVNWENLRENWNRFKVVAGGGDPSLLPRWNKYRPDAYPPPSADGDEDLDSDVPF
jgi:hypothetical protein